MDVKFELSRLPRNCSIEEIVREIKRVDSLIGKEYLTIKDYDKIVKVSSSTVKRIFGGWQKALIAAHLDQKYSGIIVSDKMQQQSKHLTNEEVLDELKKIALQLKQNFVTQQDVNSNSKTISASTVYYRFGSWENGLKQAGLSNSPGYRHKLNEEEFFENLLNVWTYYGRQPKYDEMKKSPSLISPKTYESHFGTWRRALETFVERMNKEDDSNEQIKVKGTVETRTQTGNEERKVNVEKRRAVSLGLRYKVLSRDKFKCVKCGTSPAIDPHCLLQVDHIVPFSKGGKTLLENLQTLCENCNLGKGDRHSE